MIFDLNFDFKTFKFEEQGEFCPREAICFNFFSFLCILLFIILMQSIHLPCSVAMRLCKLSGIK